jgi:O-acetylhomoserine (thiol)-lyase
MPYEFDTQRILSGYDPKEHHYAVSPPIYQTAAYEFRDVKNALDLFGLREEGFLYTRVGNPTVAVLEARIAALDKASAAIAVASGMSAISYTLLNIAEGGGRILASPYIYGASADSFTKIYPKYGIEFDFAENIFTPSKLAKEIKPDTKAIYIESVSNPNTYLLDIDAIADVAHKAGIPLVVDNTVATPYLYRPFEHGADIVIYSATKSLNGHGNVIAGLVLERGAFDWHSEKFAHFSEKYYTLRDIQGRHRSFLDVFPDAPFTARIRFNYLNYFGAALGPFDAYLALIGLETLSERVAKQSANALQIAKYLVQHEHVEWVRYPALPSDRSNELYKRDFPNGAGGIVSFGFKGSTEQKNKFLESVKLFHYHVNLGDARSLIVNSPQTTHSELQPDRQRLADIQENLIRLSAGLEDARDLIADLDQAFKE